MEIVVGAAEYQFEIWQDGMCVAGGIGHDLARIRGEAAHYAAQYVQDGEIEVRLYRCQGKSCVQI